MSRLVISAVPLMERWSVTSATRRDKAAWPPSPDTMFSALVAAAASMEQACHPALYWLEALGNPSIEATIKPPVVNAIEVFSPVADRPMWEKGSRQARWHNSIGDAAPVKWSWRTDATQHLDALQRIATEVTYVGSSRGPVLVTVAMTDVPLCEQALVPDDQGTERIRGLYAGRLDELEAAFQRGNRPRSTQAVGYMYRNEQRIASPWGQMIPLRRVAGEALHLAYSVPIAEAVRQAITRHLPDGAPGTLTGHDVDGGILRDGHMAIVPLPRVDDKFADGDVVGVGLLLPRSLSDQDYNTFIGGLGRWLGNGGHVDIGRIRWTLEVAHDDHRMSLRDTRYSGAANVWTSVTPVVFDRHPRRNLGVGDVVRSMCADVGLPVPTHVEATRHGQLTGSADSGKHALGQRDYFGRNLISHVRIQWPRKVPGPIVLGRGRYFGLGVLLPDREAA
jgi:CRISPR-associated protein Csb2